MLSHIPPCNHNPPPYFLLATYLISQTEGYEKKIILISDSVGTKKLVAHE